MTSTGAPSAPLRRLTQEELNRTLRDLFVGIAVPPVVVNDGQGAGYEGDVARQTPSDLVVEQIRVGAVAVAAAAVSRKDLLLPRVPSEVVADQRAAGHELIAAFGPRALRRPMEDRETVAYTALFDDALDSDNFDVALAVVVGAFLQAPSFVYRVELGSGAVDDATLAVPIAPYEMANRLSYLLWGSMPDPLLFAAARDGALSTPAALEAQARRMLDDARSHDALLSFHRQWLDFDKVLAASRDATAYPLWNDTLKQSIRAEADQMVEGVFFAGDGKLRTLLTTTSTRVDAQLAALYGIPAPANDWDLVELPGQQRAGVITQAAFLASRAHAINPSPVLRGVYVLEKFLCMAPPPPSGAVNTTPPEAADAPQATTNRQRYAQHTFDPVCQGCHEGIDGIGMGLENYDAIGAYRSMDNGFAIDASGTLQPTGAGGVFNGGVALAQLLANSEIVDECVARQWLSWARGRAEDGVDWPMIDEVTAQFRAADGDVRELLIAVVRSPVFRFLPAQSGDS